MVRVCFDHRERHLIDAFRALCDEGLVDAKAIQYGGVTQLALGDVLLEDAEIVVLVERKQRCHHDILKQDVWWISR